MTKQCGRPFRTRKTKKEDTGKTFERTRMLNDSKMKSDELIQKIFRKISNEQE